MSPGFIDVARRHVLGRADDGDDAHRQRRAGRSPPIASSTAAPPDMSNFISLILRRGLDRDAAGVERHGLADEPEHRAASRPGRLVAQRDQLRLLVACPARRRRSAPMPRASISSRPSDLDVSAVLGVGELARALGERRAASGRWPACSAGRGRRSPASADDRGAPRPRPRDVVVGGDDQLLEPRCRRRRAALGLEARRSGRRRAACPRRARRRRASPTWWGSSQHSARAPSSRARPRDRAAATRARSASKLVARRRARRGSSACPSAWVTASVREGRSSPRRSRPAPAARRPSTSCATPSPSKTPTAIGVGARCRCGVGRWWSRDARIRRRQATVESDAPHAQDRDPRRRPHARRQARRRPVDSSTPPSSAAIAIAAALERADVEPEQVEHVVMGQVLQAGQGQIPSRQAQIKAGIPKEVSSETINKVCASGVRAAGDPRPGDPRGRRRGRRRRRHGVDVAGALPAAAGALRLPHGRREGARRDGPRRPHATRSAASRCSTRPPRSATSSR